MLEISRECKDIAAAPVKDDLFFVFFAHPKHNCSWLKSHKCTALPVNAQQPHTYPVHDISRHNTCLGESLVAPIVQCITKPINREKHQGEIVFSPLRSTVQNRNPEPTGPKRRIDSGRRSAATVERRLHTTYGWLSRRKGEGATRMDVLSLPGRATMFAVRGDGLSIHVAVQPGFSRAWRRSLYRI